MAGNKKGGGKNTPHSGAHGDARMAITRKNKERRAKRYAKWLEKRRLKNSTT